MVKLLFSNAMLVVVYTFVYLHIYSCQPTKAYTSFLDFPPKTTTEPRYTTHDKNLGEEILL